MKRGSGVSQDGEEDRRGSYNEGEEENRTRNPRRAESKQIAALEEIVKDLCLIGAQQAGKALSEDRKGWRGVRWTEREECKHRGRGRNYVSHAVLEFVVSELTFLS